jgi:hypothetical protein
MAKRTRTLKISGRIFVEPAQGGRLQLLVQSTRYLEGDEHVQKVVIDMSDYQLTELVGMLEKVVTERELSAAALRRKFDIAAKKSTL